MLYLFQILRIKFRYVVLVIIIAILYMSFDTLILLKFHNKSFNTKKLIIYYLIYHYWYENFINFFIDLDFATLNR